MPSATHLLLVAVGDAMVRCGVAGLAATAVAALCPSLARQLQRHLGTRPLLGWRRFEPCFAAIAGVASLAAVNHLLQPVVGPVQPWLEARFGTGVQWPVIAGDAFGRVLATRFLSLGALTAAHLFHRNTSSAAQTFVGWASDSIFEVAAVAVAGSVASQHRKGTLFDFARTSAGFSIVFGTCRYASLVMRSALHPSRRLGAGPDGVEGATAELTETDLVYFEGLPPNEIDQLLEVTTIMIQAHRVRHSARAPALVVYLKIQRFLQGRASRLSPSVEASLILVEYQSDGMPAVATHTIPRELNSSPPPAAVGSGAEDDALDSSPEYVPPATMTIQIREAQTSCSVCLEEFSAGETLSALKCGHVFHTQCVRTWLLERKTGCPVCRQDVRFEPPMAVSQRSRNQVMRELLTSFADTSLPSFVEHGPWHRAAAYMNQRNTLPAGVAQQLRTDHQMWSDTLFDALCGTILVTLGLLPPSFYDATNLVLGS